MPQALILPLFCAQTEGDYMKAVETSIATGGCTASRASIAGACHGALATDAGVPAEWIATTHTGKHIAGLVDQLVGFRGGPKRAKH